MFFENAVPVNSRQHAGCMWDLDDATPAQMVRRDELELIYLHLRSMDNCTALLKRTGAVPAAA